MQTQKQVDSTFKLIVDYDSYKETFEHANIDKLETEIIHNLARSGFVYKSYLDGYVLKKVWDKAKEYIERFKPTKIIARITDVDDYGFDFDDIGLECEEGDLDCFEKAFDNVVEDACREANENAKELYVEDNDSIIIPVVVSGETPDWYTCSVVGVELELYKE